MIRDIPLKGVMGDILVKGVIGDILDYKGFMRMEIQLANEMGLRTQKRNWRNQDILLCKFLFNLFGCIHPKP